MKSLLIAVMALYSFSALGGERVCVLSFFQKDSKEQTRVEKVFRGHAKVILVQAPTFREVGECFSGEYDEVVWASHGTVTGITEPYITPVYVDRETGTKSLFYRRFFDQLAQRLPDQPIHLRVTSCGADDDKLPNTMTPLFDAIRARGGTLQFSPRLRLVSAILGRSVTDLSKSWLAESLR